MYNVHQRLNIWCVPIKATRNCNTALFFILLYFSAWDQSARDLSTNTLFRDFKLCITQLRGCGVIKVVIATVINEIMNKSVNTIKVEVY